MSGVDVLWLAIIGGALVAGAVAEALMIARKHWGGTLTHRLRDWFNVHTDDGKRFWIGACVSLVAVVIWLWGHVQGVWP